MIRGLIRVRDAVRRCLHSQLDSTPDEDVLAAREQLNRTYDSFVARLGSISERANTSAFRSDPDLPLLLSLEQYDEEMRAGDCREVAWGEVGDVPGPAWRLGTRAGAVLGAERLRIAAAKAG